MTTIHLSGKILLVLEPAIYTFVPPIVYLNKTYANNLLKFSHARFQINASGKKLFAGTLPHPNAVSSIYKNVATNLFFFSLALLILITGYIMPR